MSTRTPATEGQAKIREALEYAKKRLKWAEDHHQVRDAELCHALAVEAPSAIDEALSLLSPPIVGELTEEEIERITLKECPSIAHLPQGDHLPHLHGFQRGLRYARDHGYLAQAPQSSPAPGLTAEERSVLIDALYDCANRCETKPDMDAALEILRRPPAPSVIEAGDAMENMMRRLRTQRDDEGILPTGNDFNGMDGLCAAWVAAKASRPSVTAPQGVTVDQILEVVNDWRANMHLIEVPHNTPYSTGVQNVLRSRLSALLTK